jgi:hypothetical protein
MSHALGVTPFVILAIRLVIAGGVIALLVAAARRR